MAPASPALSFDTSFDPRTGEPVEVAPGIVRVTAPNAGPYTFKGTNSFILGSTTVAVVDPGPLDDTHLRALLTAIGGRTVEAILLTHTHKDHSALAPRLRAETGAPLWFGGPHRPSRAPRPLEQDWVRGQSDYGLEPDRTIDDGETLTLGGIAIEAIATPGHCSNHLCFGFPGTPWLLSGDHVMGWNSTLVPVPDGSMADYLDSLDRVIALPYRHYLPAHGGPIMDGPGYARALRQHRELRNDQIVRAVNAGARSVGAVVRAVYPKLPVTLIPAARMTTQAHIEYLAERGLIRAHYGLRIRLSRSRAD
jgi:glyoxylase-like metal-dependent hydrolase (beta-lactamase superfamily II)